MYAIPIAIHPRSGDTSESAQIPQNRNMTLTETISRLSVERRAIRNFRSTANEPPSSITARFTRMGDRIVETELPCAAPNSEDTAREMAMLYATRPTTSSMATTCKSVSTKSPRACVCRMVIIVEAGAVADASAESTIEKAISRRRIK